MRNQSENVLTEDFLYELYYGCFNYDNVCDAVCRYMRPEYLPGKEFKELQQYIAEYRKEHKSCPTLNIVCQIAGGNKAVSGLLSDIKECAEGAESKILLEQFESYIKQVRFQLTYKQVGEMYSKQQKKEAMKLLESFSEWSNSFTLKQTGFLDVIDTFESRYKRNKEKAENELKKKSVNDFYIDELTERNHGQNLRKQLTVFLASTGVGKSHVARWIGSQACYKGGLNVLHFQLEGSEDEVADAYSASLIASNSYLYSTGKINEEKFEEYIEVVKKASGTLRIKAYAKFSVAVSTFDIKNVIEDYKKTYGYYPDVIIVDSLDLIGSSSMSNKRYNEDKERYNRIQIAQDLKDIAEETDSWMIATYQSTIENREWINDENNVLTEYNCSEAKGLSRPVTHLVTLNQSDNERKEQTMRLNVAKSRFFAKGKYFRIATDYEHERFYDKKRTGNLNASRNR